MKTMPQHGSRRRRSKQRGAALILTVIVIMVLTTLGMAMVTFTTTEERTATTYRDAMQTRALAEAGVRVVQEMFRSPTNRELVPLYSGTAAAAGAAWDYWGTTESAVETNLNALGIFRHVRAGATPARYTGNNNRFFFPPYRDNWGQTFGGSYNADPTSDVYDLKFNCTPPSGVTATVTSCWLDTNINALLTGAGGSNYNLDPGKITDISFYEPPVVNGSAYGIATVRVTAEKWSKYNATTGKGEGTLLARETVVALIGDRNPEPAVMGNGDIRFITQGGGMCGDGCENIHANGNAEVGDITGGQSPMVTATGTVSIGSGSAQPSASYVTPPDINPFDDAYKPTNATDLGKFYLVASRDLPSEWTDNDESNNPSSRPCGYAGTCQDYGLEYIINSTTARGARTAADVPHIYKWNDTSPKKWDDSGCTTKTGTTLVCNGLSFSVAPAADNEDLTRTDTASIPFNKTRVPMTVFHLTNPLNGATVLVDGKFDKSAAGQWNPNMTIIAVGSLSLTAQTEWYPASATERNMWIAGRDIYTHANCCAPSNTCTTNLANSTAQGVIAAHEQILGDASQTALAGIVIAENRVNYDPTVNSTMALDVRNGDHDYQCGVPSWPWVRPTKPEIFSMTTAAQ